MRSISHILSHTATISRAARSIVNGQVVDSFVTVATGVPCRLTSPTMLIGNAALYGMAEQSRRPRLCYFEPGADVRKDDRLLVNGANFRALDVEDQPDMVYRAASVEVLA